MSPVIIVIVTVFTVVVEATLINKHNNNNNNQRVDPNKLVQIYECPERKFSDEEDNVNHVKSKSDNLWEPHNKLLESDYQTKQFSMISSTFECHPGRISKEFHWHPSPNPLLKKSNVNPKLAAAAAADKVSNMSLLEDGSLVWNRRQSERRVFRRDEYCVSSHSDEGWVSFKVCTSECTETHPCIQKCCPPSSVLSQRTRTCVPVSSPWPISSLFEPQSGHAIQPSITFGFSSCAEKYIINVSSNSPHTFKYFSNGTFLQIDRKSKSTFINPGEFCVDRMLLDARENDSDSGDDSAFLYSGSEWDQVVIACKPTPLRWDIDGWLDLRLTLFASLHHISAIFLLITDVVYIIIYKHHNFHGWLQFTYATALFFTFLSLGIVQIWSHQIIYYSPELCKTIGQLVYFSYLTMLFTLTAMNFDLWYRICWCLPPRNTCMRSPPTERRRFFALLFFSIAIPVLIAGIAFLLDSMYSDATLEPPFVVPGFGKGKCYFQSKRSQIPYLYVPGGFLLLIDLALFFSVVLHLDKTHDQSTMRLRKKVQVIAEIFFVMGIPWVLEIVSWIAGLVFPEEETPSVIWIFLPIGILNSLQGVIVFLLFVCRSSVKSQLIATFRMCKQERERNKSKETQLHPLMQ